MYIGSFNNVYFSTVYVVLHVCFRWHRVMTSIYNLCQKFQIFAKR